MRARDVRALLFCFTSTALVLIVAYVVLHILLAAIGLAIAYLAVVMTRPRMIRVMRRVRGEPDWSGYFKNR